MHQCLQPWATHGNIISNRSKVKAAGKEMGVQWCPESLQRSRHQSHLSAVPQAVFSNGVLCQPTPPMGLTAGDLRSQQLQSELTIIKIAMDK